MIKKTGHSKWYNVYIETVCVRANCFLFCLFFFLMYICIIVNVNNFSFKHFFLTFVKIMLDFCQRFQYTYNIFFRKVVLILLFPIIMRNAASSHYIYFWKCTLSSNLKNRKFSNEQNTFSNGDPLFQ